MIIAQTLLLLAVVSSSIWKLGGTSGIFGRGDGESLPYPDLGGAFRALFDWDVFNFLPGASEPVPPRTDQNAGTVAEPEFKLNAETSQPPGTHGDCNQVSALSSLIVTSDGNRCDAGTPWLIFVKNCASPQNEAIKELLIQLGVEWYVSMNNACGPGSEFYGATLNPGQVAEFEAMIEAGPVLVVVADEEVDVDDTDEMLVDTQSKSQHEQTDPFLNDRLKKRGETILQANANHYLISHLTFLSYPYQMSIIEEKFVWPGYRYFSSAGAGVVVYVIDNGAQPANDEFATTGVIERWLYAANVKKTQTEYVKKLSWKGHGSCSASLVAGPNYGVAKNAKVIMVKNSFFEGGILDAFQKIINDLENRNQAGQVTAGYTVVTLSGGFKKSTDQVKRQKLGDLILKLLNVYQVVIVIAAGPSEEDDGKELTEINTWPQLFSYDPLYSSMITVGAVSRETGTKFSWSFGSPGLGPGVNVWAPGRAYCAYGYARASRDVRTGTSISAPIVAGLAAYFLALEGVGDQLRQNGDIPGAVLKYIQKLSQLRDPAYPSVWNGLNTLMSGPDYGWKPEYGLKS